MGLLLGLFMLASVDQTIEAEYRWGQTLEVVVRPDRFIGEFAVEALTGPSWYPSMVRELRRDRHGECLSDTVIGSIVLDGSATDRRFLFVPSYIAERYRVRVVSYTTGRADANIERFDDKRYRPCSR